jgi:FkbM family methyltransferase
MRGGKMRRDVVRGVAGIVLLVLCAAAYVQMQLLRRSNRASTLVSDAAVSLLPAGYPLDGLNVPVSIEWAARSTRQAKFLADPSTEVAVYRTDFAGSTTLLGGKEFWGVIDAQGWEPRTFRVLRTVLSGSRGRVYVDVGAWIGPTVLFAAQLASAVYAFEPDPVAFSSLAANVAANPQLAARTHIYPLCVAPDGQARRFFGVAGSSEASAVHRGNTAPDGTQGQWTAACVTLQRFMRQQRLARGDVALIKIDVEGMEAALLPSLVESGLLAPAGAAAGSDSGDGPATADAAAGSGGGDGFATGGVRRQAGRGRSAGEGVRAGVPQLGRVEEQGPRPAVWLSVHGPHWGHDAKMAATLVRAMSTFPYMYDEDLRPVPAGTLTTGTLCRHFCTYLLADQPFDFTE